MKKTKILSGKNSPAQPPLSTENARSLHRECHHTGHTACSLRRWVDAPGRNTVSHEVDRRSYPILARQALVSNTKLDVNLFGVLQ